MNLNVKGRGFSGVDFVVLCAVVTMGVATWMAQWQMTPTEWGDARYLVVAVAVLAIDGAAWVMGRRLMDQIRDTPDQRRIGYTSIFLAAGVSLSAALVERAPLIGMVVDPNVVFWSRLAVVAAPYISGIPLILFETIAVHAGAPQAQPARGEQRQDFKRPQGQQSAPQRPQNFREQPRRERAPEVETEVGVKVGGKAGNGNGPTYNFDMGGDPDPLG